MARKQKISEETTREYHHHSHFPLWRWGFGIFIILIGAVYLLNNFGVFAGDIVQMVWKLWPIFIIIAGISLLYPRQ